MAVDNYNFKLVGADIEAFTGYVSAKDKTILTPGDAIRGSFNVIKKISGTWANRPGLLQRGPTNAILAGIRSAFTWKTNAGITYPLRVMNQTTAGSDGKLQVEIADTTQSNGYRILDLLTGLSLTRFVFDTVWDEIGQKDVLVMANGDTGIKHWSGGITTIASATITGGGYVSATVVAAGTGYVTGDTVKIVGGNEAVTLTVVALAGSIISFQDYSGDPGSGYESGITYALTTVTGVGAGGTLSLPSVASFAQITKTGTKTWIQENFESTNINYQYVVINGHEYQYHGGESTTTLTGLPVAAASEAVGSYVISKVIAHPNLPATGFTPEFLKVSGNQVAIGSYSSREMYLSADSNANGTPGYLNYTNTGSLVTGDPDQMIFDAPVKGIGLRASGQLVVFAGTNYLYLVTLNTALPVAYSISGGSRFVYQKTERVPLSGLSAALAHEFIDNLGNSVIWLDQEQQLRSLAVFTNNVSVQPTYLSLPVREEFKAEDFTNGSLTAIGDTVYITAPNSSRDWMFVERQTVDRNGQVVSEKFWNPPQIRGVSCFTEIDGLVYGYSNSNPMLFQIWDTNQWHDDSSAGSIAYDSALQTAYRNNGRRWGMLSFDKFYVEGYLSEGTELNLYIYYDYLGSNQILSGVINSVASPAKLFEVPVTSALGESPLGVNPLGANLTPDTNDQDLLPKFKTIIGFSQVDCFEYSPLIYSTAIDARWEVLCLGPDVTVSPYQAVFLNK